MDDDGLPAETEPLISEELRQRGIDVLQGLLAGGKVDLDRFQIALDGLLEAPHPGRLRLRGPQPAAPCPIHSGRTAAPGTAEGLRLDG